MTLTIMFNLAVVLEEKGIVFDAINLYNRIIEENPLYIGIVSFKKAYNKQHYRRLHEIKQPLINSRSKEKS